MIRYVLVSLSVFWTAAANADEYCILPVAGSEPQLSVEVVQPYRIATSPKVIPGFDGLIVKAFNRHELYEFDGARLKLVESDFPNIWGYAYEHGIHTAPSGEAYGFGSNPKVIFYNRDASATWTPVEETQGYNQAFFDQGSGHVYWRRSSSSDLRRLANGTAGEKPDLPVFNGEQTTSVLTVPEIDGALALTGARRSTPAKSSSIWFRSTNGVWIKIAMNLPEGHRLLDTFQDAKVQVIDGLLRIFPSNPAFEPLFFRMSSKGLSFVGSAPKGGWQYHPPSKTWIGWSGSSVQPIQETRFGFWKANIEAIPPRAFALGPDEFQAHPIPGAKPPHHVVGQKAFFHPRTIVLSGDMPALVSSKNGLSTYDGTQLTAIKALANDVIGELPMVQSLGLLHLIQSEKGVFLLDNDLSLVRIDNFPSDEPWPHEVSIDYIEAWQSYVVVDRRSGNVYTSLDMREFSIVASPERISKFVGVLPEPATVLMVGESRLFAMTNQCKS